MRRWCLIACATWTCLLGTSRDGLSRDPVREPAETESHVATTATSTGTSTSELLRLVAMTGLIGGLIYLTAYGMRRLRGGARAGCLGRSSSMEVVESMALGGRRFLLIVRVGRQHVLVGATDQGLHHVADLSDFGGEAPSEREAFRELVGRHTRSAEERAATPLRSEAEARESSRGLERTASSLI